MLKDSFNLESQHGVHTVLVFEPLREPIWVLGRRLGDHGLELPVLKAFVRILVQGLAFAHSCDVVHTDLKADNLLVGFEDDSVIEEYVTRQQSNPSSSKEVLGHTIFESHGDFGPLKRGTGKLRLCDFGLAVQTDPSNLYCHEIQPQGFSAPEVLLGAGWDRPADIWNLEVVLWELLQERPLVLGLREMALTRSKLISLNCTSYSDRHQTLYWNEPILEYLIGCTLQTGSSARRWIAPWFDCNQHQSLVIGELRFPEVVPPDPFDLHCLTHGLSKEEEDAFIAFALRMLKWNPAERVTAEELYEDPWLA